VKSPRTSSMILLALRIDPLTLIEPVELGKGGSMLAPISSSLFRAFCMSWVSRSRLS
jgi:hypothetical protein